MEGRQVLVFIDLDLFLNYWELYHELVSLLGIGLAVQK